MSKAEIALKHKADEQRINGLSAMSTAKSARFTDQTGFFTTLLGIGLAKLRVV